MKRRIKRRVFLGRLITLPFLNVLGQVKTQSFSKKGYLLNRFSTAGFQYYLGPRVIGRIKPGDRLAMIAEPGNPYDEFAVRLEWKGQMIGYVPRSDNRHLSRLLRQGARLKCQAISVEPDRSPWNGLKVEVSLLDWDKV